VGLRYSARVDGVNLRKRGIARTYLNLDDSGQCFRYRNSRFEKADFAAELAKLEASLAELGETLAPFTMRRISRAKKKRCEKPPFRLCGLKSSPRIDPYTDSALS